MHVHRMTDAELDAQMDEIGKEETALEAQAAELRGRITGVLCLMRFSSLSLAMVAICSRVARPQ